MRSRVAACEDPRGAGDGTHQIHLEIDWCSSRDVALDLSAGQEVRLTCKARAPNYGQAVLGSDHYVVLDVVSESGADGGSAGLSTSLAQDEPGRGPDLPPGAPTDAEIHAAWEDWTRGSDDVTELRGALRAALESGDRAEADHLKLEVQALLADHAEFAAEYKRLKAQRPDWRSPRRGT